MLLDVQLLTAPHRERLRGSTCRVRHAGGAGSVGLLDILNTDLVQHILQLLTCEDFFAAALTCREMHSVCTQTALIARISLGDTEDESFPPARRKLLTRLANAGNAAACYRLGVALSYHPAASMGDIELGREQLLRAIELADSSLRADAAFECWLLMRRLPDSHTSPVCSESLLELAASLGHSAARFGKPRPRKRDREADDFRVSTEYAVMQRFLVRALKLHSLDPQRASICHNPSCGRWGVRARARVHGVLGPPALPRCQGLTGGHCRARYCSRFCQAIHWKEHRKVCSLMSEQLLYEPYLPLGTALDAHAGFPHAGVLPAAEM